jgi:hypothetical protein
MHHPQQQESDIFVHCSDHRIHIWSAVKNQGLLIHGRKFDRIVIYGGPTSLAYPGPDDLETDYRFLAHQLRFGLKTFPPPEETRKKRIVLIGHNCGYYANILRHVSEQQKRDDLFVMVKTVKQLFHGNVDVEAYYAIPADKKVLLETIVPGVPIKAV